MMFAKVGIPCLGAISAARLPKFGSNHRDFLKEHSVLHSCTAPRISRRLSGWGRGQPIEMCHLPVTEVLTSDEEDDEAWVA
jgi:hypothetical protein